MDTKASEPLNGAERFHEALARVREAYTVILAETTETALAEFVMPEDRITLARDIAKFTAFFMALRCVQERMLPIDWPSCLKEWRQIEKELHREIPDMLLQFVRAKQAEAA